MRRLILFVLIAASLAACSTAPSRSARHLRVRSYAAVRPKPVPPPVEYSAARHERLIDPDHDPFAVD